MERKRKWVQTSLIGWDESGPVHVMEGTGVEWRMRKVVR